MNRNLRLRGAVGVAAMAVALAVAGEAYFVRSGRPQDLRGRLALAYC